ncbi:MAG: DUF4157 domain-containing protein [Bacteroidetes bacterium]|nr:MAG: DUF4157 domain-containing protein [Bacteroidota bacterium]
MKEPAKPQNTHQEERTTPFFSKETDNVHETSHDTEAPFFTLPAIQTKLKTGQPGDRYEQQADRMADRVINHEAGQGEYGSGADTVQLQEEEEEPLQMMEEEEELQLQQVPEEEEEELLQPKENDTIQKQEEEEELQMQEEEEEEELLQPKENDTIQKQEEEEELQMQEEEEEEELLQPKENDTIQKQEEEEEEMLQMQEEEEEPLQMMEDYEEEEPLQMQHEEEEELQLQQDRKGGVVNDTLSGQIKNASGKGQPLPETTNERMSDSFGVDFSQVKIHKDTDAVQMSRQLGAQAFTHGSDIFFNAGKYNPESTQGQRLLAHELTHVVQQRKDHAAPKVQGFFKKIGKGLKKVGKAIAGGAKKVAGGIAGGAKKVFGAAKKGIKSLGKGIKKVGTRVWGSIKKGGKKVWGWLKKTGSKVWSGMKKAGQWVWNGIKWVGGKLWEKLKGIAHRAKRWITSLPSRLKRLVLHLWEGVKSLKPWSIEWWKSLGKAETWKNFGLWLGELVIYYYEVLGVGEILETLADFIKFNTRPMTSTEKSEAQKVFGNKIDYSLVRIDEYSLIAWIGKKKENADNMAVTTFHTINFSRKIEAQKGTSDMAWLIHELVHVWQYEKMGAMYMARAVHAQNNAGYDYKGIDKLQEKQDEGLNGFNLEQQGDIISDYYRILYMEEGLTPKWAKSEDPDISVYKSYVEDL